LDDDYLIMKMYDTEEMLSLSRRASNVVIDCGQELLDAAIKFGKVNELVVHNILRRYDLQLEDLEGISEDPDTTDLYLYI
jgi:hypothetical protein